MRSCFMVLLVATLIACHDESDVLPEKLSDKGTGKAADSIQNQEPQPDNAGAYFPPADSTWQTIPPDSLGWNLAELETLLDFLESTHTYGFIVLHNGRIALEKYWNDWNQNTAYPVASAGKSITAVLTGIAQADGLLDIGEKTSRYLGTGWTGIPQEKENLISLRHHLSMTTGLDEADDFCTEPSCLHYRADAGQRWAYHNGPYYLVHKVIEAVSGKDINTFTREKLAKHIGLANWSWTDHNLALTTRDMARFGLLMLNRGTWNEVQVIKDTAYFRAMISPSSSLNRSYGYLWWLNGKESHRVPGDDAVREGPLIPSAPEDLYAAMGKGDKKIYIIPAMKLVVVRHGDDAGVETFGPSSFDTSLWTKLRKVFGTASNN